MIKNFVSVPLDKIEPILSALNQNIDSLLSQKKFPCILFSGDLGTGKTTFIRKWMDSRNSSELVNSPTFALHNLYDLDNIPVHHFDLYRIKDTGELFELGFDEIWGKEGISLIEWWEIAESMLPKEGRLYLNIEHDTLETRNYILETPK